MVARSWLWQAACIEELVIRVPVVSVGLALANLIQHNRSERNRFQILSLVLEIGDYTFPDDRLVKPVIVGGKLKMKFPRS